MQKQEKQNHISQRGITLIALVITIIIMLILVTITISISSSGGLFNYAGNAVRETQNAINREQALEEGKIEINGVWYNIIDDYIKDNPVELDLKIGDYVNYTYDTVATGYSLPGTQSGYSTDQTISQSATTLKWRILNIDENAGTIDLVSAEPTDNTVYFMGALGYNNGVYLLDDMCKELYSNTALGVTARSIDIEDLEKHLTEAGEIARDEYISSDVVYGGTKTFTGSSSYYPNLYSKENGSGINTTTVKADGISESNAYYKAPTNETYSQASTSGLTITATHYRIAVNPTNYGEVSSIFYTPDIGFWVASRAVSVGINGRKSFGYFF